MIRAYYNDHDKKVCAWLEQLIKNGEITKGDVDDRSITEITADDIAGYDRVHLFAGIGTWDYALNQAGWGDRPVLTASLPCQPFSAAGKGLGKEDERHLLPQAVDLIIKSGIDTIFGEQVERAIAHGWLDDLQAVMEAENYAVGHVVLGAHSVNAAHIRQRLYWVAHSQSERCGEERRGGLRSEERESWCGGVGDPKISTLRSRNREPISSNEQQEQARGSGVSVRLGDSERTGLEGYLGNENSVCEQGRDDQESSGSVAETGCDCRLANTNGEQNNPANKVGLHAKSGGGCNESGIEWIYCRDNKYRPVKPGIKPLVDWFAGKLVRGSDKGAQIQANNTQEARTMRLKGYGNAIQAQTAEAFIRAFMSI